MDSAAELTRRLDAARKGAAVGPPLRRGLLRLTGKDALDYLHRMCTQDVASLPVNGARYAAFLTNKGALVGEGNIIRRGDHLLVDVDPAAVAELRALLEKLVIMDEVELADVSDGLRVVPVLGPEALARVKARDPGPSWAENVRRGVPAVDVYLAPAEAEAFAAALAGEGLPRLSEGDLEALRIAGGVARFGVETAAAKLPMELGLTRPAISFGKGCYLGQEVIVRGTVRGHIQKGLVKVKLPAGVGPGATLTLEGKEVGVVTSAADLPEGRLALAHVRRAAWAPGTKLATPAGEAEVVTLVAQESAS